MTCLCPQNENRTRDPKIRSSDSETKDCLSVTSVLSSVEAEVYVEETRNEGHRVKSLQWET